MGKSVVVLYPNAILKKYNNIYDYATIDFRHLYFSGNMVHFYGEVTLAIF